KIYLSCPNARECGMVTCDGLITFLKNGERYIESSRHGINALPEHERAVIGTASDYNAGALRTMRYALELLSPYAFPYALPFETRYKDALAYRLGLAAMSARGFAAAKSKAPFPVCDTVMEFIPLPYINERADIPAWHGLLKALKARASSENVAFSLTTAGNKESAGMPEIGITDSDKLSPGGSVAVLRIK
ncbi:MAG: hypothetical protein J5760_01340, partial [Clostridia bacterium]|nr:hypothetical protein [Clostridia bacterium]